MIRRLKLAYELYNYFHKNELIHNEELYKKYGIDKKYFSSISSEDFSKIDSNEIINKGRTNHLDEISIFKEQDSINKESINKFDENGYCIIKNYLNQSSVDQINKTIDELLKSKEINFKYGNKIMFAIHKSNLLKQIGDNASLKQLLDYLIIGNAQLFQSINFLYGSEQKTHSDSIHMTTFPHGGLLGVWLALEDIGIENGSIHYYPKSHKLPYYMNRDYNNMGNRILLGNKGYTAYERMIENKIREQGIQKEIFEAKSGDLFIWHANLLHGGEPHLNKDKTRKSMVFHYFDSRRVCYHEITQRPALLKNGI